MLGWFIAVLIAIPDGMIWSELGAAMPGSGGTYLYLREGFGRETFGRFLAFLFIWQFIISGPLEIASGYRGFATYLGYIWKDVGNNNWLLIAVVIVIGVINIALLYRQITSIGKITVSLWIGTLLTTGIVIFTGANHFDAKIAFDFPPDAFKFSTGFLFGLGAASQIGVYDYLGYYDICYIGEEVKEPGRVIPRSIIISLILVALIYFAVNLSIIGIVSWREFVPAEGNPNANYIIAIFMEKIYGSKVAVIFTLMVLWTAFGSVFALLLGYSRIPYAAAKDGYFFKAFSQLHAKKQIPHRSLIVIGVISIIGGFFSLDIVIAALLTTRILIQFVGQIFAVMLLRKLKPDMPRPYKIWLYPLPNVIALIGWLFIFVTSDWKIILFGLGSLVLGVVAFFMWSWRLKKWPFAEAVPS